MKFGQAGKATRVAALLCATIAATPAGAQILSLTVNDALLDLDSRVTLDSGRITIVEGAVTNAASAITALNATTQSLSAAAAATTATTATLTNGLTTQAAALTTLETTVATHGGQIAAVQSAVAAQAGAVGTLDGRVTTAEAALAAQATSLAAVTASSNDTAAAAATNTAAIAGIGAQTGVLTGQVAGLDGRVAAVETVGQANIAAVASLDGRLTSTATQVTAIDGRLIGAETTIASTQAAVAMLDTRVTAQGGTIVAIDGRVTAQGNAIVALDTRLADATVIIGREQARNDTQDQLIVNQSVRIDQVGAVATDAKLDVGKLRADVDAGRAGIVRVEADDSITVGASLGGTMVSVAGTAGTRRISGVAAGTQADDVATVGQLTGAMASTLGAANAYTDRSIQRAMDQQMGATRMLIADNNAVLRREIDAVGAHGAALSGLPQAIVPGRGFAGASIGGKGGEVAFALGASKAFAGEHAPILRAGAAIDTRRGDMTYNAGVGFHF